jgi:hypothetical protein
VPHRQPTGIPFDRFVAANQNGPHVARKEAIVLAVAGAVFFAVLGGLIGGESKSTAAMSEGVLRFLGACLGAITGAVIGGSMDIVRAINQSRVIPREGAPVPSTH